MSNQPPNKPTPYKAAGQANRILRPVAALILAFILLGQGIATPFVKDAEPQSAQWIVDIVHNGRWLLPLDYYGLVDRKPPLFYWMAAGISEATGGYVDETRARVVSLIAAAALATVVLEWTAAMLGTASGWLAFFFLIGSYAFASRATTALTDMLMSAFLIAVYYLIHPALDETRVARSRIVTAGLLLGLGVLTKGPIVIVLFGFAAAIYLLMLRRNPFILLTRGWPWMIFAIAIVIAAGWYIPAFLAGRANDLSGVFIDENFGHFMPASMGGTGEAARPVYYILVRLLSGALPLTLLLPAIGIAFARDEFVPSARRPLFFQLAMVLAVLIFFSAASAKRDDYILPALPPLATLFAGLFTEVRTEGRASAAKVRDITCLAILALVFVATIGVTAIGNGLLTLGSLSAQLQSSDASYASIVVDGLARQNLPFIVFEVALVVACYVAFTGYRRNNAARIGAGLAALCVAGSVIWNGVVRPIETYSRSQVAFAAQVRALAAGSPVYVAYFDPEFAWYYGPDAPPLPGAIAQHGAQANQQVYLVARPRELNRLAPPVRRSIHLVLQSHLLGGGGPPALYAIGTAQSPDEPKGDSSKAN